MPVTMLGLSLRLTQEDLDRLEAVTAKLGNVIPRTALARQALLLGLAKIEAEGLAALEPAKAPATKTKRKT